MGFVWLREYAIIDSNAGFEKPVLDYILVIPGLTRDPS
jgi:hypothetical protein